MTEQKIQYDWGVWKEDEKENQQGDYCDHNWYTNAAETKRWCCNCDQIEVLKKCE